MIIHNPKDMWILRRYNPDMGGFHAMEFDTLEQAQEASKVQLNAFSYSITRAGFAFSKGDNLPPQAA